MRAKYIADYIMLLVLGLVLAGTIVGITELAEEVARWIYG